MFRRGVFCDDLTAILADDLTADAQLHAGAAPAGRADEIGLEYRGELVGRDGAAVIADLDHSGIGRTPPGSDADRISPVS